MMGRWKSKMKFILEKRESLGSKNKEGEKEEGETSKADDGVLPILLL